MANIQILDSYLDYILREKKAAMRLADYKDTGVWNEDSAYDDVELTEDEVIMFGDIYRSKFFIKKTDEKDEKTMIIVLFPGNHEYWKEDILQYNDKIDIDLYESITWNGINIMDCELSSESDIVLKAVLKPNITSFRAIGGTTSYKSVKIPSCITKIEDWGLNYLLDIQSITFAENSKLEEIGKYSIVVCEHLTSIELPSSLKTVHNGIFAECWSLNSITCHATTAPIIVDMQNRTDLPKSGILYYPKGSDYSNWLAYLGEGWQGVEI